MLEAIKELRARTHLGMAECNVALKESDGDVEKAIALLQQRGLKKVEDVVLPTEGAVFAATQGNCGVIAEINCQTDFGAKSEPFQKLLSNITQPLDFIHNEVVNVAKQLGENVVLNRIQQCVSNDQFIVYNHPGGKIAVLLEVEDVDDMNREHLSNVAMQIAATKPLSIDVSDLPATIHVKQIDMFNQEVSSKPEAIRNKIAAGKMNKWYAEVVLLNQLVIFDESKITIREYIENLSNDLKIRKMIRYERGEQT